MKKPSSKKLQENIKDLIEETQPNSDLNILKSHSHLNLELENYLRLTNEISELRLSCIEKDADLDLLKKDYMQKSSEYSELFLQNSENLIKISEMETNYNNLEKRLENQMSLNTDLINKNGRMRNEVIQKSLLIATTQEQIQYEQKKFDVSMGYADKMQQKLEKEVHHLKQFKFLSFLLIGISLIYVVYKIVNL